VIDDPFAETKDLIAGFRLWQETSMEEALEWIRRSPFRRGEVEISPVFEIADFGLEFTPERKDHEEHLRAQEERYWEVVRRGAPETVIVREQAQAAMLKS
jgi:hypothetical protein